MLTGIENIKTGSGVTTDAVTQYQHKSLNIWDTPGILAGECEQHDAKALEAISKADLLVYVITNELFDDVVGAAFRDLCFKQGRAGEIMIVINKFESDSADKETKISGITQVLEPKIPEDFPIVLLTRSHSSTRWMRTMSKSVKSCWRFPTRKGSPKPLIVLWRNVVCTPG
jgi:hypothetical protein